MTTASNASCTASGKLPSGAPIAADGLGRKTANAGGGVTWFFAAATREHGTGTYTITCTSGANKRTVTAPFTLQ